MLPCLIAMLTPPQLVDFLSRLVQLFSKKYWSKVRILTVRHARSWLLFAWPLWCVYLLSVASLLRCEIVLPAIAVLSHVLSV